MVYDAIIIGAGPGGYATALRLGQKGRKVLLIEKDKIGGECLNYGCIPSKALIELSHSISYLHSMPGIDARINIDMPEWQKWKWSMINKLTGGVEILCRSYGVEIVRGDATIKDKKTVSVNGKDYECENLVIATGSRQSVFDNMNEALGNRDVLDLKEIPKNLVIIGAGYIGIELGTAFAKLGSSVTIVEIMDTILPGVNHDLAVPVERKLKELGINVRVSTKVMSVKKNEEYEAPQEGPAAKRQVFEVSLESGEKLQADYVLLSVGRKPNTEGFGLENLGLELDHGFIKTDNRKMTSVSNVYAVGDVSGGPMLAHKAYYDADVAADNICGIDTIVDYRAMPFVIYSDPEISYTGSLEGNFSYFPVAANGRALGMNSSLGFYRIYHDEKGNVSGAAVVAPHSSELMGELSLAVESGLNAMDIGLTIHPHPTISEGVKESAEGVYGKPLHFKPRS